jgi:hypothetical protein
MAQVVFKFVYVAKKLFKIQNAFLLLVTEFVTILNEVKFDLNTARSVSDILEFYFDSSEMYFECCEIWSTQVSKLFINNPTLIKPNNFNLLHRTFMKWLFINLSEHFRSWEHTRKNTFTLQQDTALTLPDAKGWKSRQSVDHNTGDIYAQLQASILSFHKVERAINVTHPLALLVTPSTAFDLKMDDTEFEGGKASSRF